MTKTKVKIFSKQCILRYWVYRAVVSKKTGRLLRIKAGCRCWETFHAAYAHYEGMEKRWRWGSTDWVLGGLDARVKPRHYAYRYALREEAIRILQILEKRVQLYKFHLTQKRRRVRK